MWFLSLFGKLLFSNRPDVWVYLEKKKRARSCHYPSTKIPEITRKDIDPRTDKLSSATYYFQRFVKSFKTRSVIKGCTTKLAIKWREIELKFFHSCLEKNKSEIVPISKLSWRTLFQVAPD